MVIDPEIPTQIPAGEFGEVQTIMQDWPQHPIGKAAVVFVKTFLRKIGDYFFDILGSNRPCSYLIRRRALAPPPQPDAPVALERWPQCNFEPASALGAVARNRNAVGNDD